MDQPLSEPDHLPRPPKQGRTQWLWLLVVPVMMFAFYGGARTWLSHDLLEDSELTLGLYVTGLEEILGKFHPLPEIYALHPLIQDMLANPSDPDLRHRVDLLLENFNTSSQASDTYVLDPTGLTLAASNWNHTPTFVGRNFSYRPYFQDAMDQGQGRFFALGTTSLQRGYYLSSAVNGADGKTKGVVVVKVDVAKAETGWKAPTHEVMVTDNAGIVFLSSRPEWLYNALEDPPVEALVELGETKRYADKKIGRLPYTLHPGVGGWAKTLKPTDKNGPIYLATYQDIADAGWRVWILANSSPMLNTALVYAGLISLMVTMTVIAVFSLIARRRSLLHALSVQQRARQTLQNAATELEHQVEKRTADLERTQNELVQAGKMAALGQMSVGINHELNQPLTAIRSYAANAVKLLEHGRTEDARENMSLISTLSERMGDIILRLKIFARESSEERNPHVLQTVIRDTMRIVEPRLKKDKVTLDIDVPPEDIIVLVNDVRLEQVLVNLINNAMDAFESDSDKSIRLTAVSDGANAIVQVLDNGPGIPDDVVEHLFEPFFTTKDVGIGLGLGLSISYGIIQEFGGELNARNLEGGGAAFTFNIPLAK